MITKSIIERRLSHLREKIKEYDKFLSVELVLGEEGYFDQDVIKKREDYIFRCNDAEARIKELVLLKQYL